MTGKKIRQFYYCIKDRDRKLMNCFLIDGKDEDEWNRKVEEAQKEGEGRQINSVAFKTEIEWLKAKEYFESSGLIFTNEPLIEIPESRENEYMGILPGYAQKADRSRVISIFCRKCCKQRWAEMFIPYPGKEVLRRSEVRDFKARCLWCNNIAYDCYNWTRGRY